MDAYLWPLGGLAVWILLGAFVVCLVSAPERDD